MPVNRNVRAQADVEKHATTGTEGNVPNRPPNAAMHTSVTGVGVEGHTADRTVQEGTQKLNERIGAAPKFRRQLVWDQDSIVWDQDSIVRSKTVRWTETADPLPSPPPSEFLNSEALSTIQAHPELFQISTPIDVNCFESLLSSHPNQPFVRSVCKGLREGFWPYADTHYGDWPTTWDNSQRPIRSDEEGAFLRSQVKKEVEKGRFSPPFGPDLLPGMYSMPIHAVPKPGSAKFRLVTDHSAGLYALNHMISCDDIAGVTLDNVQDLGRALRLIQEQDPEAELVLWKADVSEAYRQMPMHPLWQVKQVVTVDSHRYVNHCNVFGGRASQRIFHAFMSLVIWIAVVKLLILYLYIYVDDSFSVQKLRDRLFYPRYQKSLPTDLVRLLQLWDFIGLPHEEKKQIFGPELPIIGFDVEPNLMRVRMPEESKLRLITALQEFAQHGTRRSLRDFQHIAGYLNWALNVFPLLRPGLCAIYAKTTGKLFQRALIWVNRDVERELKWVVEHLLASDGILILKSSSWDFPNLPPNVLSIYCDALPVAMGFWIPSLNQAFQAHAQEIFKDSGESIFYLEALCVCAAILHGVSLLPADGQLAVFTDNLNTVQLFNSLAALPSMNWMVMACVDVVLAHRVDFRVFHIPGEVNVIADLLSHLQNSEVRRVRPSLSIAQFQPPCPSLGAVQK